MAILTRELAVILVENQGLDVIIPSVYTSIDQNAFYDSDLTSVVIPDGVTTIGEEAFEDNKLTSIVIPDSVTMIGESAFEGNKLTSVFIPDSVTTIGEGAFEDNHIDIVRVPNNVNPIVAYAFDGDVEINRIKIRMVFSQSQSDAWISNELDENTPQGIVAELVTDDPDLDYVHSYALVLGDGDDDNHLFEVDRNQLRILEVPDYERKANYSLRIKTSYSDGRSYSNKVNIKVNNLNESNAPKSVQSLHKEWLFSIESSEDNDPDDIAIDSNGGIYVVGSTESPVFLGEQVPEYDDDLSSGYIFKVSPEGSIEWTELIHGNGVEDYSFNDVAVDNFNYAYVLGTKDYDKAFITRYSSSGSSSWKNPIPIVGGDGADIQIDSSGSIYAVTSDNYLSKYTQGGSKLFSSHLKVDESGGETISRGIETGSDGSIYVVGHHLNKASGDKDGHLMKYSSDGTKIWERVFGGYKDEKAYEVIQSSDGSIYVIGATQSTIFDGKVNTQDWVNSETWDKWDAWECFLIKYNTDGEKEWTRLFGGSKRDKAYDLSEGVDGLIYIVGETSSPDFVGKNSVRHIRGSFFTSFTPDGEEQWTDNAFQNKHSEAIAIAKDGSIVVGGGEDVALIKYVPDTVPTPTPDPTPAPVQTPEQEPTPDQRDSIDQIDSINDIATPDKISTLNLRVPFLIGNQDIETLVVGTNKKDKIIGSSEGEVLAGGVGKDVLKGGGGADGFLFNQSDEYGMNKADKIKDFDSDEGDSILVDKDVFGLRKKIKLKVVAGNKSSKKAARSKKDFVYDDKKGLLYFNENGKQIGWGDGGLFAKLLGAPELGADDFTIV